MPICSSCGQENPEGFRFCGRRGGSRRGAAARWRGALAKVLAVRGQEDGAEALAQEAATLVEPTPFMALQGDVLADTAVWWHRPADRAPAGAPGDRPGIVHGSIV